MLSFKIAGLLLLAFMTMSLNLQANHQEAYSFVKVFKMDSSYSLPKLAWNEWADFPSLAGSFYLYQDQIVTLSYSIQTYSTGGNYICTRLLIDGADDDRFRVISPATRPTQGSFHSNAITVPVKLSKGKHKIKVQFRSDATISGITVTGSDWLASYAQAAWTDYWSDWRWDCIKKFFRVYLPFIIECLSKIILVLVLNVSLFLKNYKSLID